MNILFLSSKSPYPLKDGHSLRTFNILKQVSKNNRIFFLTYFLEKSEEECFEQVSQLCAFAKGLRLPISEAKSILAAALIRNIFSPFPFVAQKYRTFAMQREIERILKEERIDVVHVDILPLMINYPLFKHLPVVLVEHNVESLLLKRRVKYARNLISKIFWWMQALKLSRFEKRQLGAASVCAAVSQEEKKLIEQLNRKAKTDVVPNGVDTEYFFPDGAPKEENTLIFVGGLNWFPNNDGMNYFCEEIYQKISANLNNLQVFVAGKEDRSFRYGNLVKQLGFVSDIRPYVRDAKVFIVPLRIGGGSRLKILDAMAMGKAIVSTSIGCEGLEVKNGIHLLIEDTPSGFARAVTELCLNTEKREFLAKNARKLVEEKYDWETIGKKMNQVYEKVLAN